MSAEEPTAAEQIGLQHAAALAAYRTAAFASVLDIWDAISPDVDFLTEWFSGPRMDIYLMVAMGQELAAADASPYVRDVMAVQGYEVDTPEVNPVAFSGIASDGRPLDTLLDTAVWRVFEAIMNEQRTPRQAKELGTAALARIVHTQITDAGREADQVAVTASDVTGVMTPEEVETYVRERQGPFTNPMPAPTPTTRREKEERLAKRKAERPTPIGWIRLLTPPSCARCALLAGRWYGWNDGFERHPNCDCRHVPALEADSGEMITDVKAYFDSLSPADQAKLFGKANAEAIREGADPAQIVNATTRKDALYTVDGVRYTREGSSRRAYWRQRTGNRAPRKTPVQIYRDANGDRDLARRMLVEFGYIDV